ncbi:ATPase, T2SS/T4P/T4SS family [Lysinibacillus xylanilyticus]|uniref:ATPase, T2SS/T4P/T4SS family n=1 Tax=Lysinibacillus xylanilyticus TaxID=582475 RepID=UPI002E234CD3|nr:ATPase, T2SS/T4P/T4SS family [Lysinibacillus xylanilyticus]
MKNTVNRFEFLSSNPTKNNISIQKLMFQRHKNHQIKPKIRMNESLSKDIIDSIREYLKEEKYKEIIRDSFGDSKKKDELRAIIHDYISKPDFSSRHGSKISDYGIDDLTEIVVEKIAGLDVLQPFVETGTITDIKCIGYDNIWVDDIYKGKYQTDVKFDSEESFEELCRRFEFASEKTWSHANPSIDAVFPQLRIKITGFDITDYKTSLQIRIISKDLRYTFEEMISSGFAIEPMVELLKVTFASHCHLVAGSTGTGKTELLRRFAESIPNDKEIMMIEDHPETYLNEIYPNKSITMRRNRANANMGEEIGFEYHIRNAMRDNMDFILVQESRGKEFYHILDAAMTDHILDTTLHGKSVRGAFNRAITLCQREQQHPKSYYGELLADVFKFGIHIKRIKKKRVINELTEFIGYDTAKDRVIENPLIKYNTKTQKHEIVGKISKELWDELLTFQDEELGIDLTAIKALQELSPYAAVSV